METDQDRTFQEKVLEAMRKRCAEQGHEWENCCTMMFQIYQQCKYCGEIR